MPEGLEAELYRGAAARAVGRTIAAVDVDDRQPAADELRDVLPGRSVKGARRHGKLVVLALGDPRGEQRSIGLHFGMTGRLIVDGVAPIEELQYGARRDDPAWDRLVLRFVDGGVLRVNDPRRWATFTLDPDVARLGRDFLSLTVDDLMHAIGSRRAAIKSVLLDQTAVAGFGNLCADEVLWQAGVSPVRPANGLHEREVTALVAAAREHLPAMLARGGSHTGTIDPAVRAAIPPCPRDGRSLERCMVGGRTTVWCPAHQT